MRLSLRGKEPDVEGFGGQEDGGQEDGSRLRRRSEGFCSYDPVKGQQTQHNNWNLSENFIFQFAASELFMQFTLNESTKEKNVISVSLYSDCRGETFRIIDNKTDKNTNRDKESAC